MTSVLGWALNLTLWGWLATEVIMQVRQYRMGGKAKLTEWGSLGAIVVSIAAGTVLATITLHSLHGWDIPLGTRPLLAIALPVLWVGIGFRLWAIHTLGRFFRGVVHVQADHEVVRRGPYRLLRHPSYAGALVAIAGLGLTFGSWASLVVYAACGTVGVLYRIRVEERVLLAELGAAYADYAATTSRLVPRVW